MRSAVRIALVIAVAVAAASASSAATTPPWRLVAYGHKPWGGSAQVLIQVKMPVGQVAGRRQPDAFGFRLIVRRQDGRYLPGWASSVTTCGGWRHTTRTAMGVKTPLTREIPFRAWRARSCVIDVWGSGLNSRDEVRLELRCRATLRRWCTPIPPPN